MKFIATGKDIKGNDGWHFELWLDNNISTHGKTRYEAVENLRDAIALYYKGKISSSEGIDIEVITRTKRSGKLRADEMYLSPDFPQVLSIVRLYENDVELFDVHAKEDRDTNLDYDRKIVEYFTKLSSEEMEEHKKNRLFNFLCHIWEGDFLEVIEQEKKKEKRRI